MVHGPMIYGPVTSELQAASKGMFLEDTMTSWCCWRSLCWTFICYKSHIVVLSLPLCPAYFIDMESLWHSVVMVLLASKKKLWIGRVSRHQLRSFQEFCSITQACVVVHVFRLCENRVLSSVLVAWNEKAALCAPSVTIMYCTTEELN